MLKPGSLNAGTGPNGRAFDLLSNARRVLEGVIISSESFDYPKAKAGLKELERMIRKLGREEARLRAGSLPEPGRERANVVPFPANAKPDKQPRRQDSSE